MRDSGEIEEAADSVLFLFRSGYYDEFSDQKNVAEVIIAKQRNGPDGVTVELFWEEYSASYRNLERQEVAF